MVRRVVMAAIVATLIATSSASAQQAFVAVSGGATVGDLYGGAINTDSRWGGTAGVSLGFRNWNYFVTELEANWVQKGGGDTRLDYIEIPALFGAVVQSATGLGVRAYTGIGIAFPVSCSSEISELVCDSKKSPEWAWPFGLQFGRWLNPNRFFALDVRYSIGLSDAFDLALPTNRSWQFRAFVGFPVGS
ncbi:MAG: outer membrane beta-barrel protein [Gemmatimonadota bacterium]|nr:MAG: outer membrane beta-barrel protein [Gemmatimonadota bacterium]